MGVRRHQDPVVVDGKRERLFEPHVAPITELARKIEDAVGLQVPGADPDWGGVDARVLILLRDPGTRTDAEGGSGLVSPDNDDPTAERLHELIVGLGLAPSEVLLWNVVPWLRSGNAGQGIRMADLDCGNGYLAELLAFLGNLEVVLVLGRDAQKSLNLSTAPDLDSVVRIDAPHPSRRAQNQQPLSAALDAAFEKVVAARAGGLPAGSAVSTWPGQQT